MFFGVGVIFDAVVEGFKASPSVLNAERRSNREIFASKSPRDLTRQGVQPQGPVHADFEHCMNGVTATDFQVLKRLLMTMRHHDFLLAIFLQTTCNVCK